MKDLVDTFQRKINYLRISITDRCNLRCVYCMPIEGVPKITHDEILRYEEILKVVEAAVKKGIQKIRITGGEPLVRKGVIHFIHSLSNIPSVQDLSLTTNGILLKDYATDLYKAGLCRINVSIDSLNRKRFHRITRGGELGKVWEGVKKATEAGISPIKINTVIIRGINDDEIIDFAKLSIHNPFHVRFIEFMPVGSNSIWSKKRYVSSGEIKDKIEDFKELHPISRSEREGPARMFKFKGTSGKIGFISPFSDHFCSSCNRLRLTVDGKLRTCLFSDNEVDLRYCLRKGTNNSELERLIDFAISNKPERHKLQENTFRKCSRNMSEIGG
ncbi:MAG: GTP 3',8-cyclase MoaA [Thermodesulfobacteriota bacterium]|nr:GTP 3',8-cyclase MoaA [Thermodesulfobacteriota bacterium]